MEECHNYSATINACLLARWVDSSPVEEAIFSHHCLIISHTPLPFSKQNYRKTFCCKLAAFQ